MVILIIMGPGQAHESERLAAIAEAERGEVVSAAELLDEIRHLRCS